MLIEFNVANYRSFRDEVTFSMVASPLKAEGGEPDVRNQFAAPGDISLLTSAAIYGANASGKSNLIAAINFMRNFAINSSSSTEKTGGIDVEPFRLSTQTEAEPSYFEVVFIIEEQHFRYGFEVTPKQVVTEWLHVVPTIRESSLFDFDDDEITLFERERDDIVLGERFEAEGRDLAAKTRPNALFLSVGAQFNGKTAQMVLEWFRSLRVTTGLRPMDQNMRHFTESQLSDEDSDEDIKDFIRQLDLGIKDILIEKVIVPIPDLPSPPDDAPENVRRLYSALGNVQKLLQEAEEFEEMEQSAVRTVHLKMDDEGHPAARDLFYLDRHESEGTKKLFALSGPLTDTLKNGKVLIIDELDARLHPLLTQQIVRLFNDPEKNANGAQLVFTTQDTSLLDYQLLRRDQIWFTEKDHQGASHLYSLVEFKIDNDAPFERDYIQGRYGAIPFLGNIRQVFLEDE